MRKYIFKYKGWLFSTVFFRSFGALMQVVVALLIERIIDTATNKDLDTFIQMAIFSVIFFLVQGINDYLNKISINGVFSITNIIYRN